MTGLSLETAVVSGLLVVVVAAILVRRINLPYTALLVLVGLLLGFVPLVPHFELTPAVILLIFLPPLLFEASFNLHEESLRESLPAMLLLAIPGTVVGALVIAALLRASTGKPLSILFVFGALVAATDPISVLAVFRRLGVSPRLATIVEGESLFNDGVAIVLFGIALEIALGQPFHLTHGLVEFVRVALGGVVAGLVCALLAIALLRRITDALIETALTTVVAFGAYVLAERLGVSGVIAVVVAGIILSRERAVSISPSSRVMLGAFWEYISFLGNSMIFLLMGMRIAAPELWDNLGTVALVMLVVLVSRLVIVVLANGVLRVMRQPLPWRWLPVLTWGGLRGAVTLALALSLPAGLPERDWMQVMAFGVVLVSLLGEGLTMEPLVRRLGLSNPRQVEYERHLARLFAINRALRVLDQEQEQGTLLPNVVSLVRAGYEEAARQEHRELEALEAKDSRLRQQQLRLTRRQALLAERAALHDLGRQGQISAETLDDLLRAVDTALVRLDEPGEEPAAEEEPSARPRTSRSRPVLPPE
ncbi:MAG TPA: Na+/H+ antiporter [Thermomicrobiaceae bacterium]|nr:Na+/H+ antiporter [Thermomicrobiaceae bacterium]